MKETMQSMQFFFSMYCYVLKEKFTLKSVTHYFPLPLSAVNHLDYFGASVMELEAG